MFVYLINRRRILVNGNDGSCDGFRFNGDGNKADTVIAAYDSIWSLVKWLGIVSTSTAVLSVMMVLLVMIDENHEPTQKYFIVLYSVCLVGLFCSVVMMWKARYLITNDKGAYQLNYG